MSLDKLKSLYKEIILENGTNPQNFGRLTDFDRETTVYNPSCGDRLHLMIKLKDEQIDQIAFEGEGCTISKASASMMTQLVKDKNVNEAVELGKIFSGLAMGKTYPDKEINKLGDAQILTSIMEFPARIKCATLAWWGLDRALLGKEKDEQND